MFTVSGQTEFWVVSKFLLAAGSVWLELGYCTFHFILMLCFSQLFSFVLLLKIGLCCLSLKFSSCTADIQKSNSPFLLCCCKRDLCVWFRRCAIVCVCLVFIWKALGHSSTLSSTTPKGASAQHMIFLVILTVFRGLAQGTQLPSSANTVLNAFTVILANYLSN